MIKPRPVTLVLLSSMALAGFGSAYAQAASSGPTAHAAGGCGNTSLRPRRSNIGQIAQITLCLINRQRAAHGLRPLRNNGALDRAARGHSVDMVRHSYFSHTTPRGVSPFQRILGTGYSAGRRACAMGENIAAATGPYATPASIVNMWMGSAGHRANILDGTYRDSGIGIAIGFPGHANLGATYTEDFGRRC
jgi:uncharacterized protein YkwD